MRGKFEVCDIWKYNRFSLVLRYVLFQNPYSFPVTYARILQLSFALHLRPNPSEGFKWQ